MLVKLAIRYACLADGGSFCKRRVTFPDVVRVSPDGSKIVFGGRDEVSVCADACGVSNEMFAAVSRSAVLCKSGGFAQPGVKNTELINL